MAGFLIRILFMSYIVAGSGAYADEARLLDREWMKRASPVEVEELLERGAALDARDKSGVTPLHFAAQQNMNPEATSLLLELGADPSVRDGNGKLPADLAERNEAIKESDLYWRLHEGRF